jgi:hypothetical protein
MQASFSKFKAERRKPVSLTSQSLVRTTSLVPGETFPLVIEPELSNLNLVVWVAHNRDFVETELLTHGAILFRNFEVETVARFEEFARAISGDLLDYKERAAPRREVGRMFTLRRNIPLISPSRYITRCLTRTIGRQKSGFIVRRRHEKKARPRLPTIAKSLNASIRQSKNCSCARR